MSHVADLSFKNCNLGQKTAICGPLTPPYVPETAQKGTDKPQILCRLAGDSHKPRIGHIFGYMAQNAIPRAPNPPGPGVDDVSAIIVVWRLSIADAPWWRVDTRTGQFYHSMAAGTGSKQTFQWSTGRREASNRTDLWNEDVWKPSNLWDFYSAKAQTLGPGQYPELAREHVILFQYKCPVDGHPGDPNLQLLNH